MDIFPKYFHIAIDKWQQVWYNDIMIRNNNNKEKKMLIYEKHTKLYSAEIRTTNHPTTKSKYVATFSTIGNVTPRCYMTCGWQTLKYAHNMINKQIKNTLKYNQLRA